MKRLSLTMRHLLSVFSLVAMGLWPGIGLFAATVLSGSNDHGQGANYSFTVSNGATNISLAINNSPSAFSYLLLKKDSAPTDVSFDYAARLNGAANSFGLEKPQLSAGTWYLRVFTPLVSAPHQFRVAITENDPDVRQDYLPAMKPLQSTNSGLLLAPDDIHYYRVEVPPGTPGWRVVLNTAAGDDASLYIRQNALPNAGAADKSSEHISLVGTLLISETELLPGAYFIGVKAASSSVTYTLHTEIGYANTNLVWDPGLTPSGTQVFTNVNSYGGDFLFKIVPQATDIGAWRTALKVTSGEADIYLQRGNYYQELDLFEYRSARAGSDGFVLPSAAYMAGEEWFAMVHATPGAQWTLLTGRAYVENLGTLAADSSSSKSVVAGPEGAVIFKTTVPVDTLAWRLWLNGANKEILVKQSTVPVPGVGISAPVYDLAQMSHMLVVPDYLNGQDAGGTVCFVSVGANPGDTVNLDSRKQPVSTLAFGATTGSVALPGHGYATYKVQVPIEQIAWEIKTTANAGQNVSVAVRRDKAPNEFNNDAFSEAPLGITDSVTLVPPTLSDGTFYITVYADAACTFQLRNGNPVITPISYIGSIVNDDPNRAGWRYYTVTDISSQLGSLGWYLFLQSQAPNSEIAIRRNAVPGRWDTRQYTQWDESYWPSWSYVEYVDQSGINFLQQPGHQADVWYVGVYSPYAALGSFKLNTDRLLAQTVAFSGGKATNTSLTAPRMDYYAVAIPANTPSWKIKLTAVSGDVSLSILKDALPLMDATPGFRIDTPPGNLSTQAGDEHFALFPPVGRTTLEAGTYYLGVASTASSGASSYILQNLGPLPITSVGTLTTNGTDLVLTGNSLAGGETKVYQFVISNGVPSLEVHLENKTGAPVVGVRLGAELPYSTTDELTSYGSYGGANGTLSDAVVVSIANPAQGVCTIIVKATDGQNATYNLRVHAQGITSLNFDGGKSVVTSHPADLWRFFRVTVPANPIGWDLRITNLTGGDVTMIVRRDELPDGNSPQLSGFDAAWPTGYEWSIGSDWTGYTFDANGMRLSGKLLVAGMGSPLQPGVYFVGVKNVGVESANYTIVSRGIGAGFSIPVASLAFNNGSATVASLPAHETAYYQVVVPANTTSWKVKLTPTVGDASLFVKKDSIPNIDAVESSFVNYPGWPGKRNQKPGNEHFAIFPANGETYLPPGTNYLAVVSEGIGPVYYDTLGANNASFTLVSQGPMPILNLGTAGATDLIRADTLEGGEIKAYQFTVPSSVLAIEVWLENRSGIPMMSLVNGAALPSACDTDTLWSYGGDGGNANRRIDANILTWGAPSPGVFSLIVKGVPESATSYPDAGYTVRIKTRSATELSFNGGSATVYDQLPKTWKYFHVTVPGNALGWDVRSVTPSGGLVQFHIRRDLLPDLDPDNGVFLQDTTWPSGAQWSVGFDWTGLLYNNDGRSYWGNLFAVGMGNPLQAGSYNIGVYNYSEENASYTVSSRGIGQGFQIPVQDLAYTNGLAYTSLPTREAAYYRVTISSNNPSWNVKLNATDGESMLLAQKGALPGIHAEAANSAFSLKGGQLMRKPGNEHFAALHPNGATNLPAGIYYLAVIGEGINTDIGNNMAGYGSSQYSLISLGELVPYNLGAISAGGLQYSSSQEGGELKAFRFTVPAGIGSLELQLSNTVGAPVMTLSSGARLPTAYVGQSAYYGSVGGENALATGKSIITVPSPAAGEYRLIIKADSTSYDFPNASYTLLIRPQTIPQLNFSELQNGNGMVNTAAGQLLDGQSVFYRIDVPATLLGNPVIGWRLDLAETSGSPTLRVCKGQLPTDSSGSSNFRPDTSIIVPEFLSPGTWYVEIKGSGNTEFTLASHALSLVRPAWVMPKAGQLPSTPGLTAPLYGDSGIDASGQPIHTLPSDLGTDLGEGDFHYYAVTVPDTNAGLLHVQLDAINGAPNLYVRAFYPSTLSYGDFGIYDYVLNGTETQYGNWVPFSDSMAKQLSPGTYYLAVHASGNSNARYRLRISTGNVADLTQSGGTAANQSIAGGDWRYFRVLVPTNTPVNWSITFTQHLGDVVLYLRDTVPPGQSYPSASFIDWNGDHKNQGPYPSFDEPGTCALHVPPVRPGQVYYLGFYAKNDAIFSVGSSTSGSAVTPNAVIPFYGGFVTNNLPAYGTLLYRIDAPLDAAWWLSKGRHSANVTLYLAQGTLPAPPSADYTSQGANSIMENSLSSGYWPWVVGQSYYLLVTNTANKTEPFSFTMDGRNVASEDTDHDGLPDAWEMAYFGSLSFGPNDQPLGNGITVLQLYQRGMLEALTVSSGKQFAFDISGAVNKRLQVQGSTNLLDWVTLQTTTNTAHGIRFQDISGFNGKLRFYRVIITSP